MKKIFLILFVFIVSCNQESDVFQDKYELSHDLKTQLRNNFNEFDFNEFDFKNEKFIVDHNVYISEIRSRSNYHGILILDSNKDVKGFAKINDTELVYYDVLKDQTFKFEYEYSEGFNLLMPNFKDNMNLTPTNTIRNIEQNDCKAILVLDTFTCTLSSLAIAASDGPLPFMDAVAASVYVTCNASAAYSYRSCMRGTLSR